jgi:hypothetical protein
MLMAVNAEKKNSSLAIDRSREHVNRLHRGQEGLQHLVFL